MIDHKIIGAMFIIAFFAFPSIKLIYASWAVREMRPSSRFVATQRLRYNFLGLGQGILVACAAWLLSLSSVSGIVAGVKELFAHGAIGWITGSGVALVAVSPLISVLALIGIYCQPSVVAHKRRGSDVYRTTRSYRLGIEEFVRVGVRSTNYGLQRVLVPA